MCPGAGYTGVVNITFSADENLIEQARQIAQRRETTLDEEFLRWLATYAGEDRVSRLEKFFTEADCRDLPILSREERNARR